MSERNSEMHVVGAVRRLVADRRGNVALLFAFLAAPLIASIGSAIDYSRAAKARSTMQTALDSTALMIAKDSAATTLTQTQLDTKAREIFQAMYTFAGAQNIQVTASQTSAASSGGSTLTLSATGNVDTYFMRAFGSPTMSFGSSSTTSWGQTRLKIALALDNTGSMSTAGKMTSMQSAARDLIDQLSVTAASPGDVYISLVPFANVVNMGASYRSSGYIDWSFWSSRSNSSVADRDSSRCTTANQVPSLFNFFTGCGSAYYNTTAWNGCVTDRQQSYDVTVDPASTAAAYYPADQSSSCPIPIMPLSYNWSLLKTTVNLMSPSGPTNQPIGLVWAWQTLQTGAPFSAPADATGGVTRKAIVLLSDGLNTRDRWYGDGSNPASEVDARQRLLCDNIKAQGVILYTIQVNTDGDPESAVLKYCASTSDKGKLFFFPTSSASGIKTAFDEIAASLRKLRIAG